MNDAEIVRRVLNGDVNAYAQLIDAHASQIIGIAARHVPQDRAAEVAHETFVRAYERLATYKGESPFVHWLSRIALRRCADFWRGRGKSRETPFSALGTGAREWIESIPDASGEGLDAHAERSEAGAILDWALAKLAPEDRQVLVMTHMDGQTLNDVAELMGWSLSKVKVRSHRARRKLRDVLGTMLD
ncbi:MAG: RNA polymerase sigma factor [Desulfovibrio sp.]|jgi:RNA polymerase sigma-70 factor (ECF subfamily)|nr:RNA polymerase sigma factor [Desulfovibrio sp.]